MEILRYFAARARVRYESAPDQLKFLNSHRAAELKAAVIDFIYWVFLDRYSQPPPPAHSSALLRPSSALLFNLGPPSSKPHCCFGTASRYLLSIFRRIYI